MVDFGYWPFLFFLCFSNLTFFLCEQGILIDMENLSNEELREQLARYGIKVGPVVATTRNVYLKRLRALQGGGDNITQTPVLPMQGRSIDFFFHRLFHCLDHLNCLVSCSEQIFDDAEHDIYLLDDEEQYHGCQSVSILY